MDRIVNQVHRDGRFTKFLVGMGTKENVSLGLGGRQQHFLLYGQSAFFSQSFFPLVASVVLGNTWLKYANRFIQVNARNVVNYNIVFVPF